MKSLPNILIVDDDNDNLFLLQSILSSPEVNLIEALSGSDALKKIHGIELALAILDIKMPEMNGYELALKINTDRLEEKVPIIFLTASYYNDLDISKGYDSGAVDYIIKPKKNYILLNKVKIFIDLFNQKQKIIEDATLLKESADELIKVNADLQKSEEKYRSYIENAPDGVFVVDEKGRYIEVNEAGCRITGYSKEEILKMSISDFEPEKSNNESFAQFMLLLKNGSSKADLMFKHKNGTIRWWTIEGVKLSKKRFLGFAKDVTNRKQAEEEVKRKNEFLDSLIQQSPIPTFVLDDKGILLIVNEAFLKFYAVPDKDLILGASALTVPQNIKYGFDKYIREALKGNEIDVPEQEYISPFNNNKIFVKIKLFPIFTSEGKLTNVVVIQEDITKRKKVEAQLKERVKELYAFYNLSELDTRKGITMDEMLQEFTNTLPSSWQYSEIACARIVINKKEFITKNFTETIWKQSAPIMIEESVVGRIDVCYLEKRPEEAEGPFLTEERTLIDAISERIGQISQRIMNEQKLKISEKKYRTILDASPDGILLITTDGIITEVSEIAIELLGAETKDDLVGKSFFHFVPSKEKNDLIEIIERTMNEGLAQGVELKIRKKNQSIFTGEISITLIQDMDRLPVFFMITLRDISQRKKMDKTQIHADRMASLGEMASGIAHEINQPLNTISLVMDNVLFEVTKDENVKIEYLKKKSNKIFENITRIRNIIDHVKAFSRSHDNYLLTAFDINSSIHNAVMMISEQFKHLGISLDLQLEENTPLIIGNSIKFEQVILNLLSNAKDALLEKKSKQSKFYDLFVGIKSYHENENLIFEISDNGPGISEEDIEHIMLPFYTTKDTGKGTGLGLSISYQIINEMNGTIEISSNMFYGTTFKIILLLPNKS